MLKILLAAGPLGPEHAARMSVRAVVRSGLLAAAAVVAAACASSPPLPPPDAEQHLAAAEQHLTANAWDDAQRELAPLAGDVCPKRLRDRRDVALAGAWLGRNDRWEAFRVLEPFADLYPHSDLRPKVLQMLWEIGESLSRSNGGFLFFWSDATAARAVLEHLITRHPDTPRLADALKVLGDMAFKDGDYEIAQQRFRDLMLNRPDSEWFTYAQYRFAMSIYASLEGPEYDLDRMKIAVKELRGYLATNPENPELVRTAKEAEQRVLGWQVERHLRIAEFYRRIGNFAGEMRHLELAAGPEFASTPRYGEAASARDMLRQGRAGAGQ